MLHRRATQSVSPDGATRSVRAALGVQNLRSVHIDHVNGPPKASGGQRVEALDICRSVA